MQPQKAKAPPKSGFDNAGSRMVNHWTADASCSLGIASPDNNEIMPLVLFTYWLNLRYV